MALYRVIAAGLNESAVILRVRAALRDPDVDSCVVHKAGSHISADGRVFLVGPDGVLRPFSLAGEQGVQTC
jgi:hypothetical protein